jgi:hypothetical protein
VTRPDGFVLKRECAPGERWQAFVRRRGVVITVICERHEDAIAAARLLLGETPEPPSPPG